MGQVAQALLPLFESYNTSDKCPPSNARPETLCFLLHLNNTGGQWEGVEISASALA